MKSYPFDANYPSTVKEAIEILENDMKNLKKTPTALGKKDGLNLAIMVLKSLEKNQEKS